MLESSSQRSVFFKASKTRNVTFGFDSTSFIIILKISYTNLANEEIITWLNAWNWEPQKHNNKASW